MNARWLVLTSSWVACVLCLACGSCDSGPQRQKARACSIAPPAPSNWRLTADDTTFRDGLGRAVFLRGVDAGGRSKFAPYVPFDYQPGQFAQALGQYMDRAASWGIDVVRVPFTWAALEPTQGHYDQSWLALYDQILDAAWARGIWSVIDFHQDIYSEVFCGDGFPGWTVQSPPAPHHDCAQWSLAYFQDANVKGAFDAFWASGSPVKTAYVAAWDVMVARYRDKPGVIGFEPINEPGWGSADENTFSATTLTEFFSSMVPHMRKLAPSSLVFVEPTGFDGAFMVTQMGQPKGDGMVFAPHFYPVGHHDPDSLAASMQRWASISAQWKVPLFIGEFGVGNAAPGAPDYMSGVLGALDATSASGTEWEYSQSSDVWDGELFSLVGADGTELPVAHAIMRPYARAVAGSGITQSFDTTSSKLTLSYAPTTAVTEVALTTKAYPNGYVLDLTGACYDETSVPGRLLVQADPGATQVNLTIGPK